MKNIMNKSEYPLNELNIRLNTMWIVEAVIGYDVRPNNVARGEYIAIRTTDGTGIVELANGVILTLTTHTLIILRWSDIKRYFCKDDKWNFQWYHFEMHDVLDIVADQIHTIGLTENEQRMSGECFACMGSSTYFEALYAQYQFKSLVAFWHINREDTSWTKKNMEYVLAYIMQNLSSDIKVSKMSKMLNMSERNFRIVFKKYTGMPPKQYIEDKRLSAAMELIKTTTMMVKEISYLCGFSNQYYFSRCFKKKYKFPPTQFRV